MTSNRTKERTSCSCSREDASCLNKHIDRRRVVSPWELWSPLPPLLSGTSLMGVWGEGQGQERRPPLSLRLYCLTTVHSKTKQPSQAAQRRPSVTRRPLRTNRGIRHKSIISIRVYSGVPGPRAVNGATKTTKHSYGISNWLTTFCTVAVCGFRAESVKWTELRINHKKENQLSIFYTSTKNSTCHRHNCFNDVLTVLEKCSKDARNFK